MKEYLKKLLTKWLCCHQWEQQARINCYDEDDDSTPAYYLYMFICKKCGKIKKVKM